MLSSLFVCLLSVSNFAQKLPNTDLQEIFRECWQWATEQLIRGDPDHCLDTGMVFQICHYWEIWKVVNGHKTAAPTVSPDSGTGKTCLGRGMHCPSASSLLKSVLQELNKLIKLNSIN